MALRPRSAVALTAAASELRLDAQSIIVRQHTRQPWQQRAWNYYEILGAIHFSGEFVGNALSRVRLVGAEESKDPQAPPEITKNADVQEAINNLKSRRGGQASFMRNIAINLFIAGEGYIAGYSDNGKQVWDVYSIDELLVRPGDRRYYRRSAPGLGDDPLPDGALVTRVWRENPRFGLLADSAMRTVLDDCELLILLTLAEKAVSKSRMAGAGMLLVPNELTLPVRSKDDVRRGAGNASPADADSFMDTFTKALTTPLRDEGDPSSVVPIVMQGNKDSLQAVRHIVFERKLDDRASERRETALRSIATAIDLPPEVLLGTGDANHWGAWQIKEDTFAAHLQPQVELVCDALTVGYLQPALKRAGIKDAEKYIVWYDPAALVTPVDRAPAAQELYDRIELSGKSLRKAHDFDETDAPSEEERNKRIGIQLQEINTAITGEAPPPPGSGLPGSPGVTERIAVAPGEAPPTDAQLQGGAPAQPAVPTDQPLLPGQAADALNAGPPQLPEPPDVGTNIAKALNAGPPTLPTPKADQTKKTEATKPKNPVNKSAAKSSAAKKGAKKAATASAAPDTAGARLGRRLARLDQDLMLKLRVAADAAVQRSLERAGAKIRTRARNDAMLGEFAKDVQIPNTEFAAKLGPTNVRMLGFAIDDELDLEGEDPAENEADLIAPALVPFRNQARQWMSDAQKKSMDLITAAIADARDYDLEDYRAQMDEMYAPQQEGYLDAAMIALGASLLEFSRRRLFDAGAGVDEVGEFDDIRIPAGIIRDAMSIAGGANGADTDRTEGGGIGTGEFVANVFQDQGVVTDSMTWDYGDDARQEFQAHFDLDGQTFSSWDDPILEVAPDDDWLGVDHYEPGDHRGCRCAVVRNVDLGGPDTESEDVLVSAE
jgi:hypothetical protein